MISSSSIHITNTIITVQNLNHATSKFSQSVWSYIGHDGATTNCVVGFLGNRHSVLWRLKKRDFWFSVVVCHLQLVTLLPIFFFFWLEDGVINISHEVRTHKWEVLGLNLGHHTTDIRPTNFGIYDLWIHCSQSYYIYSFL
jgi:hypothetical protein